MYDHQIEEAKNTTAKDHKEKVSNVMMSGIEKLKQGVKIVDFLIIERS